MRRYSEVVKADALRRMELLHRQSVAENSLQLGIHGIIPTSGAGGGARPGCSRGGGARCWRERIGQGRPNLLILHADNGRGNAMPVARLERWSNDNPDLESGLRMVKDRPDTPRCPFLGIEQACARGVGIPWLVQRPAPPDPR